MRFKKLQGFAICILLVSSFLASISLLVLPVHATGISLVQGPKRAVSTTVSLVFTLDSTPTVGNCLVLVFGSRGDSEEAAYYRSITSVVETNVVWTVNATKTISYGAYIGLDVEIWIGSPISASASKTVTVTCSNNPDSGREVGNICEYSGLDTLSIYDKSQTSSGTSVSPATGATATTTRADELWIGGTVSVLAQAIPTYGFTLRDGALLTSVLSLS